MQEKSTYISVSAFYVYQQLPISSAVALYILFVLSLLQNMFAMRLCMRLTLFVRRFRSCKSVRPLSRPREDWVRSR